jgi:hypothetical protein
LNSVDSRIWDQSKKLKINYKYYQLYTYSQAFVEITGRNKETGKLEIRDREESVLRVTVTNEGEPAYSAELDLKIDPAFSYVGRSDETHDVHCDFTVTQKRGRVRIFFSS